MSYPSDIRLFGLPLETIPPGTVAQEYSITNTPQTGGDQILTDDPAGQVLHFTCNREAGTYRRAMVDGQFGLPVLVTGLPLLNGFSLGWQDGILHLLGVVAMSGPTVHYQSRDWGYSFTLVETLPPPVLAVNRQVVYKDGVTYHPVHWNPGSGIVSGMWSIEHGLEGGVAAQQPGELLEPGIGLVGQDQTLFLVGRVEDLTAVRNYESAWLSRPNHTTPGTVLPIEPALRIGGSPPCLANDDTLLYIGYAPTPGLGGGPPYWNLYTTVNGLNFDLFCRLDAWEANNLLDALRYMSMIVIYDQDGKRWLLVCAGEPDNALRPAQEVRLNLDTLQGIRLQGSGVAPLVAPSGDVLFDMWVHQDAPTTSNTIITVGSSTQTLGGFMIAFDGQVWAWPVPTYRYLEQDCVLGPRHWKGKRLTLKRAGGILTWMINGLVICSFPDNGVQPTQWNFSGPGGYVLTSVRVSDDR